MLPLWQEGSKSCSWLPQGRGGFALDIEQVHYEYADLKKVLELVR